MNGSELRDLLAGIPAPVIEPTTAVADGIAASERYLASDAAVASLEQDPYWPKWDSPWWHMVLLFELGEARRIPQRAVDAMIAGLARIRLKIFPIRPEDMPADADPYRDTQCHCALGCMWQVFAARGVDMAAVLPWTEPWFPAYQMADGGMSCDNDAYRVEGECPSSMVGTISPFEAMLVGARTDAQRAFRAKAADFLVGRRLHLGSPTTYNAAERTSAERWAELCFPRFYFYDVLRGLAALVRWRHAVPLAAVEHVATHLARTFPDGAVAIGRRGFDGWNTLALGPSGWERRPATRFPLLDATCAVGSLSPWLTRQWAETRRGLVELLDAGAIA